MAECDGTGRCLLAEVAARERARRRWAGPGDKVEGECGAFAGWGDREAAIGQSTSDVTTGHWRQRRWANE